MSPSSASSQAPEARLLVVEDEPNIRELLATSLKFNGFEVEVAGDGRTAVSYTHLTLPTKRIV